MITVEHLTKRFGRFTAVDDVSFHVPDGEAVALCGHNGAGKTTVLRCLLGLLRCRGTLRVDGLDVHRHGKAARARVGYVPQELAFHDDFRAAEAVRFFARLRRVRDCRAERRLAEVGLEDKARRRIRELSGGMKQRLALALALVGEPPILLLDEPTSNLDRAARRSLLELLSRLRGGGKTILFTSHRVDELEMLADRVLVLDSGRLAQDVAPAQLVGAGARTLKLVVDDQARDEALRLLELERYSVSRNGRGLLVEVAGDDKMGPIRTLLEGRIDVRDFELLQRPATTVERSTDD